MQEIKNKKKLQKYVDASHRHQAKTLSADSVSKINSRALGFMEKAFRTGAGSDGWQLNVLDTQCNSVLTKFISLSYHQATTMRSRQDGWMNELGACKQPQDHCARPGERIYRAVVSFGETPWCLRRGMWDDLVPARSTLNCCLERDK